MAKNKAATAITTLMTLTIFLTLLTIPVANAAWDNATAAAVAAGMKWDFPEAAKYNASATRLLLWNRWRDQIPTWVYGVLSPNPVGVGQEVSVIMFNPQVPPGGYDNNDIRYEYSLTIKKPDGTTITMPSTGTFKSDSTGSAYTLFNPDQTGNWTVTLKFHTLFYKWWYDTRPGGSASQNRTLRDYYGVTLKESTYTKTLVVQNDKVIPGSWSPVPLPTEYWTRPIEGMNTEWYQVASNWYNNAKDCNNGGESNRLQPDGTAPNSGHILWTKVTEDGGLVGGGNFSVKGEVFNAGHQYQTRFEDQIIMWGRLYYELPVTFGGDGGGWVCVDLRTGEEIWYGKMGVSGSGMSDLSFGYYYDWDDMNQHGIVNPGYIFTSNFGAAIHPRYGTYGILNLTNVPNGLEDVAPKGEVLRYVITNYGTSSNPKYYLLQWNSTKVFTSARTAAQATYNASTPNSYDWNVSAPWLMAGATLRAVQGDILIGSNGSNPSRPVYDYPDEVTFWAVNLKKGSEGSLLWMKNINTVSSDNQDLLFRRAADGIILFERVPTCSWVGYSMYTGEKVFETEPESEFNPFGYYASSSGYNIYGNKIAYGKLFTGGYTGAVSCYDLANGKLLWRYEAPTNMTIFPYYTLMLGAICDGKLYVGTHEHSADTPLFKGNKVRCLDLETGEEIWAMYGWANPRTFAIADGTLIYWNNYDHQVYAVGKGPSATAVSVQDDVVTFGDSVLLKGSVIDVSAGTKQKEQAARFPSGVPAVSDASMSNWMEYVYMQKPRPMDATGVEVTLSIIDSNNNYREIGKTTSNSDGFFAFNWKPDIEGQYTVYASFAGSESYWPSHAVTAFAVDPAVTTQTPEFPPQIDYTMTIVGVGVAILIAVAAVGAIIVLMLRKRP